MHGYIVTPWLLGPLVTIHLDCRLAPQTNISLLRALCPHSCAHNKTSQEVTHPKIVPLQICLTMEFLTRGITYMVTK